VDENIQARYLCRKEGRKREKMKKKKKLKTLNTGVRILASSLSSV
jgi:hypothetical protein